MFREVCEDFGVQLVSSARRIVKILGVSGICVQLWVKVAVKRYIERRLQTTRIAKSVLIAGGSEFLLSRRRKKFPLPAGVSRCVIYRFFDE